MKQIFHMIRKLNDWTDEESNKIRTIIGDKYTVEGELRAETKIY